MRTFAFLVFLLVSPFCSAASYDVGKIDGVYVGSNGDFGFILEGGFPNADADNQCPGATWGGIAYSAQSRLLASLLLMAKANNLDVRVSTSGCQGIWFKVNSIYLDYFPAP